jgi:hypothetical protein
MCRDVTRGAPMTERELLESAACTHFLNAYNKRNGTQFAVVDHRDKPDFLIKDSLNGEKLGIEVMHLYYDSKEAKMVLGRQPKELHGTMTISELIAQLNNDLVQKVFQSVKYDFSGPMFLVIRVASPIFDQADFEMFEDEIIVPVPNAFAEIWLLFLEHSTNEYSGLMQIQMPVS